MPQELSPKDVICWLGSQASLEKVLTAQAEIMGRAFSDEDAEEDALTSISNGIATISIHGSLTNQDSIWNAMFGITSYNDIRNAIVTAIEDEDVERILLDIDSPGGDAKGVSELSEFIKLAAERKPIDTYVSGSAFSAAYWIASASDSIVGPKMSEAGSIGVIAVLGDMTEMFKKQGVNVTVFRGGKYKALGNPYEKLSTAGQKIIQAKIDKMEGFFLDAVAENRSIPRNKVKSQVGEGLTFFAEEAVDNGLMDEIVAFDELFGRLIKAGNSKSAGRQVLNEDTDMAKKILTPAAEAAIAAGASLEDEAVQALLEDEPTVDPEAGADADAEGATDTEASADAEEDTDVDAEDDEDGETVDADATDADAEDVVDDIAAADTSLVMHLKDEIKTLRTENSLLTKSSEDGALAQANEIALKTIVNEYLGNMSIALGITPMNLANMETSALLTQYSEVRAAYTGQFKVGGSAAVGDEEDTSASSGEGSVSHIHQAVVNANKI